MRSRKFTQIHEVDLVDQVLDYLDCLACYTERVPLQQLVDEFVTELRRRARKLSTALRAV